MAKPKWRDYAAAQEWARSLKLKNQAAWQKLPRKDVPSDIPKDPWKAYGNEFQGWGNWLGTGTVANKNKGSGMLEYEQAKMFSRALGLKNQYEWQEYAKTNKKPSNIPSDPYNFYVLEWESWGVWLGTEYVAHRYHVHRPFEEARAYARTLGIVGSTSGWLDYWKTHDRPSDIPADPRNVYLTEWKGWRDFLGQSGRLTRMALTAILGDLIPQLPNLSEAELYRILQQSGIFKELCFMEKVSPMALIKSILRGDLPQIKQRVEDRKSRQRETPLNGDRDSSLGDTEDNFAAVGGGDTESLKYDANDLATVEALRSVDELANSGLDLPTDVIEDLVNNRVAALWDRYAHSPGTVETVLESEGGHWYGEIRRLFKELLEEVNNLPVPLGWSLSVGGTIVLPSIMQRFTAIRVRDSKRVMNLSTAGAGKTAAAILTARVIEARLTVVITNLSTVKGWMKEISRIFPGTPIFTDAGECARDTNLAGCFLLVNYDKFQGFSLDLVTMIAKLKPDFLILDEMHFVKQRSNNPSQRRVAVEDLMGLIVAENPNLHVLGMSATASINNLRESKKLLELISGQQFPDLATKVTVDNAMAMHHAISKHGFRFRFRSLQELKTQTIQTTRNDLLNDLLNMDGSILGVERLMLGAKLDSARPYLERGTIIYTHYIGDMIEPIKSYVANLGLTAGVYTGSEKTGVEEFVAGEVDVLIASAPVSVGLNGLQAVSNRIVVVSLPWTFAQFEQLIGRIHRQGSPFPYAEVVVPLVSVEVNGHHWSWDQERMRLVLAKRTLMDCVLDGVVPTTSQVRHEDLLRHSRETLDRWVKEAAPTSGDK